MLKHRAVQLVSVIWFFYCNFVANIQSSQHGENAEERNNGKFNMSKQCLHCKRYCPDEEEICHWCGKSFIQPVEVTEQITVTPSVLVKKDFFSTIATILRHPVMFFRQISGQEKNIDIQYTSPIKFLFLYLLIAGIINLPNISHIIMPQINIESISLIRDLFVIIKNAFLLLLFQVLFGLLFILISVPITHLCLKIVGGQGKLKDTMKMNIYGISPSIISAIPFIGSWIVPVGMIWSIIVTIIGAKNLHRIGTFRIVCSFIIFLILFFIFAKVFVFDIMHEIYKLRRYR